MVLRSDDVTAGQTVLSRRDLPEAVLWDMDGTLVDTEPYWMDAEGTLVAEFGGRWTEDDAEQMIGLALDRAAQVLIGHGVDLPSDVIQRRLVEQVAAAVRRSVVWQPGALELLAALRAAGVRSALVTMSYRELADAVVSQGPGGAFEVMVTGDEVTHGKPDPAPYLLAAERLGVDITECVAIEDSPPGITSAMASGARTLGVQHIAAVPPRPGLSRCASLVDIGLDEIARIAAGEELDLLASPPA